MNSVLTKSQIIHKGVITKDLDTIDGMVHCVYRDNLNRITGEIHGSITIKYYINGKKLSEYNAETKVK